MLSCSKNKPLFRTDVVHAPVTGSRGPRARDLGWLDRDPERETWLDRAGEDDEFLELEDEFGDCGPLTEQELTGEELAGIEDAAADELLAVEAAACGRRGPGQPGSARVFPGRSSSRAAGFGPGMALPPPP